MDGKVSFSPDINEFYKIQATMEDLLEGIHMLEEKKLMMEQDAETLEFMQKQELELQAFMERQKAEWKDFKERQRLAMLSVKERQRSFMWSMWSPHFFFFLVDIVRQL